MTRQKQITDDAYISYVNLDHRPDRKQRMENELLTHGLPIFRTRGLLPNEVNITRHRIKAMADRPQKGAIGCHFSQVSIMEKAKSLGQHAFVMEDDLVFCSDFGARIDHITKFCKSHPWDVIFLGGTFHIDPPYWHSDTNPGRGCQRLGRDAVLTDDPRMIRTFGAFCTYAYIVNKASIEKIMEMFHERLAESIGIDHMFIMLQPSLYCYAFVPGCIKQYDHQSDIGQGITKFSNFATLNKICKCPDPAICPHGFWNIRRSAYWWQDKMENFDPTIFDWHEAKH